MSHPTSQRVQFGSESGLADGRCPRNVQRVSKYRTIVADPPWPINWKASVSAPTDRARGRQFVRALPYQTMTLDAIKALPVADLAADDCHLFLWTTNRFLEDAYDVARCWGFSPGKLLVWCKEPMGIGLGGTFTQTTEYVVYARRPRARALARVDSTWWKWTRTEHSRKPDAFLDTVEQVSPGPRIELFARRQRLGWDTWGNEAFGHVDLGGQSEDTDPLQTRSGSQSA